MADASSIASAKLISRTIVINVLSRLVWAHFRLTPVILIYTYLYVGRLPDESLEMVEKMEQKVISILIRINAQF
jgi:hypothetical protein